MQTTTLTQLDNAVLGILRAQATSTVYPTQFRHDMINKALNKICSWTLQDAKGEELAKTNLTFLESSVAYQPVNYQTTDLDTVVGGNTLRVPDATQFPASGAIFVEGGIYTYTSHTATTFTMTLPWTAIFRGGTIVLNAYALPADYNYAVRMANNMRDIYPVDYRRILDRNERQVIVNDWNYILRDNAYGRYQYSLYKNKYFVILNALQSNTVITLQYQKFPAKLTTGAQVADIEDDYIYSIIYTAAGSVLTGRGEIVDGQMNSNTGLDEAQDMYKKEAMKTKELNYGRRVKTASDKFWLFANGLR